MQKKLNKLLCKMYRGILRSSLHDISWTFRLGRCKTDRYWRKMVTDRAIKREKPKFNNFENSLYTGKIKIKDEIKLRLRKPFWLVKKSTLILIGLEKRVDIYWSREARWFSLVQGITVLAWFMFCKCLTTC